MNELQVDSNEAFNDAIEIIAQKEREISVLKIQLAAAIRQLNAPPENSAETPEEVKVK